MNNDSICVCFSLPQDILEVTPDSNALRSEIRFAIKNLDGYRAGMFTPYMAFENLAKTQIKRLEQPVIKSIHLVVEQLTAAVRISTQHVRNVFTFFFYKVVNVYMHIKPNIPIFSILKMSNYPYLHQLIENNITSFIYDNGPKYNESVLSLIKMELAYMNTRHEEFMHNK